MSLLYIVLPLAVVIAVAAVRAFLWAAKSGRFDDLHAPGVHALFDDEDSLVERTPRTKAG